MTQFVLDILNGDLAEILGEDLYSPCVACVAVGWALISLAGSVEIFKHLLVCLLGGKK